MTVCALGFVLAAQALTIPQGVLYYDNSRTNYSQIYFVYGSNQRPETYALRMTHDGNKWRVEIGETVADMYRYTFVGGALREGLYQQDFGSFKDSVSHQLGLNRTATTDEQMRAGEIFVPSSGDNWAQGEWMSLAEWEADQIGTGTITGTLPVVYVETENRRSITDTETQIPATVYIDSMLPEYRSLGSAAVPIAAHAFGRVTPGGIVANLALLPAAGASVKAALAGILASFFSDRLAAHANNLAALVARAMSGVSGAVATIPGANLEVVPWSATACVAWYAAFALALLLLRRFLSRRHRTL